MDTKMKVKMDRPWFYQGPYVASGVIYGEADWPSRSHWLIPGFDPDSNAIDIYSSGDK